MEPFEVEQALQGDDVVVVAEASLQDAKRLVERCLEQGIPAGLDRRPGCASGGCTPRAQVVARRQDVPRVASFMQREWLEAARREGTLDQELVEKLQRAASDPDGYPPCPACGTAAPLVDGACSDCGLILA